MNDEMKERIKEQLRLNENKLYCSHNKDSVCAECLKNITGNVSGIRGDVSGIRGNVSGIIGNVSGLKGNVSGIIGSVDEIMEVLLNDVIYKWATEFREVRK